MVDSSSHHDLEAAQSTTTAQSWPDGSAAKQGKRAVPTPAPCPRLVRGVRFCPSRKKSLEAVRGLSTDRNVHCRLASLIDGVQSSARPLQKHSEGIEVAASCRKVYGCRSGCCRVHLRVRRREHPQNISSGRRVACPGSVIQRVTLGGSLHAVRGSACAACESARQRLLYRTVQISLPHTPEARDPKRSTARSRHSRRDTARTGSRWWARSPCTAAGRNGTPDCRSRRKARCDLHRVSEPAHVRMRNSGMRSQTALRSAAALC